MRRTRRVLHVLLALSLIVNGSATTFASPLPMTNSAAQQDAPVGSRDSGQPCHEQSTDQAPAAPAPAEHSCCEQGPCLCTLGMSTVAAVDVLASRDFPPHHLSSVSTLTTGHPYGGPARLLRPPIA